MPTTTFTQKWEETLKECSLKLVDLLHQHYTEAQTKIKQTIDDLCEEETTLLHAVDCHNILSPTEDLTRTPKPHVSTIRESTCHHSGKRGHLKAVCRSKPKQKPSKSTVGQVEDDYAEEYLDEENALHTVHAVNASRPSTVSLEINEQRVQMELDTGAAYSIVSETLHKELWPQGELEESNLRLKSYSREPIPVLGSREVLVRY